jgi:ribosome-associated protein
MSDPLPIDAALTLPAKDLAWTATRAGGPGGQNVNKVSSRVELRFDLAGTSVLDPAVKDRLRALAKNHLDAEGRLVVKSEKTRDQGRNLEDAREKLATLVRAALVTPKRRRPTRPTRGSKLRRLESKARQGEKKRDRRGDW